MNVSFDLSELRAAHWRPYVLRFGLGGFITVMTGVLAGRWGPVFGGLFLAFPVILPASTTLIASRERNKKTRRGLHGGVLGRRAAALDAFGAVYGAAGMVAFAGFVWQQLPRGARPAAVLIEGAVLWLLVSLLVWSLRKGYRLRPL